MFRFAIVVVAGILVVSACGTDVVRAEGTGDSCPKVAGIEFVCGIPNPEDMVLLRGEDKIVASSYVRPVGALYLIDAKSRGIRQIFPSPDAAHEFDRSAFPDCPGSPDVFVPLGLDVLKKRRGHYRVIVTNGGDGRRIEVFDLSFKSGSLRQIAWRGCFVAPQTVAVNGVAVLRDGGLAVTSTLAPLEPASYEKLLAGAATGSVAIWRPHRGWTILTDNPISGPNGIAASLDGRNIYIAGWGDNTLNRLDLAQGMKSLVREKLDFHPDNLRWGTDGRLYATGFEGTAVSVDLCIRQGRCDLISHAVRLNPRANRIAHVLMMPPVANRFGAATIALPVGHKLWLGSFHGSTIAIIPKTR